MNLKKIKRILLSVAMLSGIFLGTNTAYGEELLKKVGTGQMVEKITQVVEKEVSVDIRKRIQWTDATDGDAKITLQYASNSGELSVTQEMNVVLIHDKSGSMDVNYGYHLAKTVRGWENPEKKITYPILNSKQWSETIREENSESDLESEGAAAYLQRLNSPNSYTSEKGADTGFVRDGDQDSFINYTVEFNSPCQMDEHYYLLIKDDDRSGIKAWRMVHGKNLYNISNTDLHHYLLIQAQDGKTARDRALEYIGQGRRVLRMMADSGYYYSEYGETKITETLYFLDVSTLDCFEGKWMLNTCGEEACTQNDRLKKSGEFMSALVENILALNPQNEIAYVPFWGDVPENGTWKNYKGNATADGLVDISHYESLITSKNGVGAVNFTSNLQELERQINHSFTYNGTNWSRAFEKAILFLEKRTDKEKETLVLFLTDGMPQGTEGTEADYNNPSISGIQLDANGKLTGGSLYKLKNMEGVTLWAIGAGINELDTTSIRKRLELVNESGEPFYARYSEDFAGLKNDVIKKIYNTYVEKFYAVNGFYHDSLSEYFALDEQKINEQWKILEKESEKQIYGVPENVYEAVFKNGKNTGITCVYVRDIKKIYWYIGELSGGTFDAENHTMEIPVKFLKYGEETLGKEKELIANNTQFLTYQTTLEPETLYRLEIESPKLVFQRTDSRIHLRKNVAETKNYARTYLFSYSKNPCTGEKVKNPLGSVRLTVEAGKLYGEASVEDLEDGTYYFYETDRSGVIVNPETGVANIQYNPLIETKDKRAQVPWSVISSDDQTLKNKDNYLSLGCETSILFEKGAELTIVKEIDLSERELRWEHGNPTFMIKVSGKGVNGMAYVFYHTFEFDKEYVKSHSKDKKVSMSHTFYDLPVSDNYVVEEVRVSRYELSEVRIENKQGQSLDGVISSLEPRDSQFYGIRAQVNLKENPQGIRVVFCNEKVNDTWFNHVTCVKNIVKDK